MPEQIKKQHGQGMAEYLIVVMLIGLASVLAFTFLGQTVRGQAAQMSAQVSGRDGRGADIEVVGPGGGSGKHCCGVRANPPGPTDGPNQEADQATG